VGGRKVLLGRTVDYITSSCSLPGPAAQKTKMDVGFNSTTGDYSPQ